MTMIKTKLGNPQKNLVDRIKAFQKSDKANRHCADCGELGPTYICTDFGTFVCTECAGIHRELNQKVKGISVSKWTEQEVENLEAHGNTKDREVYMANYHPGIDLAEPSNQDRQRLREFMKLKYVDKRWAATPAQSGSVSRAAPTSDVGARYRPSSSSATSVSQPDLIDTFTTPAAEQSTSPKKHHHKHKKASAPEVTNGDLLDDDWGFQSAGGSSPQFPAQPAPQVHQNNQSDGLLSFSHAPSKPASMPQVQYEAPMAQPINTSMPTPAPPMQQAARAQPINQAQRAQSGSMVQSTQYPAPTQSTVFSNISPSSNSNDLEASVRMQCASLLNSLRQLHAADPSRSETAKRFVEDSLRGIGIEWMSRSYASTPNVTASAVPIEMPNPSRTGISSPRGSVTYPAASSNQYPPTTSHARTDSNPFGAMQSTSPRPNPQVPTRQAPVDHKDNNPFGEIASWTQNSLRRNSAASGVGGMTPTVGIPPQMAVSPGGMNDLLSNMSPTGAMKQPMSNGPSLNAQPGGQNPFIFH